MIRPVHINKPLTNISIAFANEGNFLADKIFPRIPVKKDTDLYLVYDSSFRIADDNKADGVRSRRVSFEATTAAYHCEDYGLEDVITERQMRNADAPLNLERDTVENLTGLIQSAKESRAADLLFTTGSWTNYTTLAATFNDNTADVADPMPEVDTAATTIMKSVSMMPNTIVIGRDVLSHLKNNYKIKDVIKYSERAIITPAILAAAFEVERLLVGTHVIDTTNEVTTTSGGFTWGDMIWVGYIAPSPGLKKPSATYQLSATNGMRVRKWHDDGPDADVVEVVDNYDLIIPATGAGFLIKDTDASG